jgi:5'-3' exonuclease
VSAGAFQPHARSGVVYYIDASYFVFRAYHSMPPDMVDGDGNATHALYGFARFLSDLMEQVRPERIGVAFDRSLRSETSFRNGIYPPYKANREAPPAD